MIEELNIWVNNSHPFVALIKISLIIFVVFTILIIGLYILIWIIHIIVFVVGNLIRKIVEWLEK